MFWREIVHSTSPTSCFSQSTYDFLISLEYIPATFIGSVVNPGSQLHVSHQVNSYWHYLVLDLWKRVGSRIICRAASPWLLLDLSTLADRLTDRHIYIDKDNMADNNALWAR